MLDSVEDVLWGAYHNLTVEIYRYKGDLFHNICIWVLVYYVVCLVLYAVLSKAPAPRLSGSRGRCLLVTAHPDDECMFFGPTILHLIKQNVEVHLLCLSKGNHDELGNIRCNELYDACRVLGIKDCHITIFNDTCLPDDPQVRWPPERVADIIQHYVEANDIKTLVSFDKEGVSFHSNHRAIFYAVAYLSLERKINPDCKIYTLDSVNLLRKYWGYLDLPLSFLLASNRFILSLSDKRLLIDAMKQHKSQLVWFRRLYFIFSRFILINTLKEVTLSDFELEMEIDD